MGAFFDTEHTNLVVYLTTPGAEPPRVPSATVARFVEALWASQVYTRRQPPTNPGSLGRDHSVLIAQAPQWPERVQHEARRAMDAIERVPSDGDARLPEPTLALLLRPLRNLFSQFRVYAMTVADKTGAHEETIDAAVRLALEREDALVLFPVGAPPGDDFDSLPAWDTALAERRTWPGLLMWTQRGAAAFLPERRLHHAVLDIEHALRTGNDSDVDAVIDRQQRGARKRILHISDLHFGSEHASLNAPLVEAQLSDAVQQVDRVVITGDLFDNPRDRDAADYTRFAQSLHRLSGKPPIAILGNHDQRALGNFGQTFAQAAQVRWSTYEVDHDLRIAFLCLNSSESGRFARGRVGRKQLTRVAAEHVNAMRTRPEIADYLTLSLIHHHPYSFATAPSTWYQRVLSGMGLGDERFMHLEDARDYLEWCARWRVSGVLHGHKHVPRYEARVIAPANAAAHEVTAIGCGSTFGAEGSPLCYAILWWHEERRRWAAAFYESHAGGPFIASLITRVRRLPRAAET